MPQISQKKKDKISEQILHYLFSLSPEAVFTNRIAQEIARDEEFTKILLLRMKNKGMLSEVVKSPQGIDYKKRQRWCLSKKAFEAYSGYQSYKN